jgi:hypothetical protein
MNLHEHLIDVRRRPQMFIWDYGFSTLAAYIQGCDWATDGDLLQGFGDWVNIRVYGQPGPLHWIGAINGASHRPEGSGQLDGPQVDDAINLLFELLLEFLEGRSEAI